MKNTRKRSIIVMLMSFMFVFGLGVFSYKLVLNSSTWAINPINKHLLGSGLADSGKVLDHDGVVLAQSSNGKRVYNGNSDIRKAMLHIVGDTERYITTSIQSLYFSDLFGYSFITGINPPAFMKMSSDIKVTLNSEVCRAGLNALGDYKGAAVLYNYKTGEVICMSTSPTFDPENLPDFKNDKANKYEGAYLNRVVATSYTPGSIFKLITGAAAIENIADLDTRSFLCQQTLNVEGRNLVCMGYHGNIGFKNAMTQSCNIAFARMAMEMGPGIMNSTANSLGFNRSFNVDKITTSKSKFDVSQASKWELGCSGFGQHTTTVNPMHMAILMGAIANEGVPVMPYVVETIAGSDSQAKKQPKNGERLFKTETANKLKENMRNNVVNNYGESLFPNFELCAKTGTAEVSDNKEIKPHGWMVGFSRKAETPFAFAVIVENSDFGIKAAGPVASAIMKSARNLYK